jgi:hypothetical protein
MDWIRDVFPMPLAPVMRTLSFPRDLPIVEKGRRRGTVKLGMMSCGPGVGGLVGCSCGDMVPCAALKSTKLGGKLSWREDAVNEFLRDDILLRADSRPDRLLRPGVNVPM